LVLPYFEPRRGNPVGTFHLTVGQRYTVYALGLNGPGTWVYIADDCFVDGPRRYPHCLFDLEDASVSPSWVFATGRKDSDQPEMLAPSSWLGTEWFFNHVVDGEPEAVARFAEMKRRIDAECAANQ
jgi:hypothetical protein